MYYFTKFVYKLIVKLFLLFEFLKNALTHTSRTVKNAVTMTWTPPSGFAGTVIFKLLTNSFTFFIYIFFNVLFKYTIIPTFYLII